MSRPHHCGHDALARSRRDPQGLPARPAGGVLRHRVSADVPGAVRWRLRQPGHQQDQPDRGRRRQAPVDHVQAVPRAPSTTRSTSPTPTTGIEAVDEVKDGDQTLAIRADGDNIEVRYSDADQVALGRRAGDSERLRQRSQPRGDRASRRSTPSRLERVEDESLETIQFVTPGLLGWAIAMSAAFGAATTLTGWRSTKLLRRLRLAPISTSTVVSARLLVTIGIALGQMVIFLGARGRRLRAAASPAGGGWASRC